jgi:4-hydroxy-2-oxoheptanedioate aldolase
MSKTIKLRMQEGESVFGTWCMLPSSFVIDVIAGTGVDFVVIDMEHGTMSLETAEEMVRAAQLHNCQPIIRVGDDQENTILHALETGCKAVMVPHVSTVESAKKIVEAARYAPLGKRGLSPYTRCHGYTHDNLSQSLIEHAEDTLVGILVEGEQGIKNLPEISEVKGIDLIYLGMYDISQSVGLPGQLEHPDVMKQLNSCLKIIQHSGKIPGTFARDMNACRNFKKMGFKFVAYIADSYSLISFYKNAVTEFSD